MNTVNNVDSNNDIGGEQTYTKTNDSPVITASRMEVTRHRAHTNKNTTEQHLRKH